MQPRRRTPYDGDHPPRSRRSSARHPADLYDDGNGDRESDNGEIDDEEITRRMGTVGLATTTSLGPGLPSVHRISAGGHRQHDHQRHSRHQQQQQRQGSLLLPPSSTSSASSAQSSTRGEYGSSFSSRRDERTNATTGPSGGDRHGRISHQTGENEERRENDGHQKQKKGFRVRWSD